MHDETLILIAKGLGFFVLMWILLDREDKTMASIIASRRSAIPPPAPLQQATPPVPQPPPDIRDASLTWAEVQFLRDLAEYTDALRHGTPIPERLRTDGFRIKLAIMQEKLRRESQNRNPSPNRQP